MKVAETMASREAAQRTAMRAYREPYRFSRSRSRWIGRIESGLGALRAPSMDLIDV